MPDACIILPAPPSHPDDPLKAPVTARLLLVCSWTLLVLACHAPGHAGTTPEELHAYKSRHYAALPEDIQGTASRQDFRRELSHGGLFLLGDIHDDRALHVLHARILQELIYTSQQLVLHLEFLGKEDEPALRQFLGGSMELDEFRQIVQERWPGSWMEFQGFDSGFYRKLLLTARDQHIRVRALESIPRLPLNSRDPGMAEEIHKAMVEDPEALHIVIVGHTHLLGAGHLVSLLDRPDRLVLLPRGSESLTHRLGAYASLHSAAWHAPYLILDDGVWLLNPLPLRSFGED